jgi:predicted alpha/beta-hydrolase family hydrolase
MPRELSVRVGTRTTTARVFGEGQRLILAHGAGADQRHDFLVRMAEGLAARGLEVVTFNFFYTEAKKRAPDKPPLLEACWRAVIEKFGGGFIGGKSMGGRIASHVADADGVEGLVFLGYPLHPPHQPEKRRDAHLPAIKKPMLFVQGERDPFGGEDEIRPLAEKLRAELYMVRGGDHSLTVPKRGHPPQAEVDAAVQQKIVAFVSAARGTRPRRR